MIRIISAASQASRLALFCIAVSIEVSGCGGGPTGPGPTPLQISCPAPIERESPLGQPITVVYAPTTTGGTGAVTTTCQPPSGGEFPVGTTTVQCTARDAEAKTSACSFDVVVKGAPKLSLTHFIAFGDSLTQGTVAPNAFLTLVVNSASYPSKLQLLLRDRYRTQTITVGNDGVPGEVVSPDGLDRFPSMLRVHDPEAVLLMEGSNDLFFYREQAFALALPALEEMVTEGQASGARVFLATIPPQRPNGAANRTAVAALIPDFNKEIRAIAQRTGATLVDIEPVILADMTLIGNDDLHPTEHGYEVIAETFFKVIRSTLEAPLSSTIR
jgi:lysophospholipase L1-like esterase